MLVLFPFIWDLTLINNRMLSAGLEDMQAEGAI